MIFNESRYNADWDTLSLEDLGTFSRGKSKHRPRDDRKLFENGRYPLVQTGDVKAANLFLNSHSATYNEFGLAQSKLWSAGTLCITIAANIAETAILSYPMCFPDSIVGFNSYEGKSTETFVYYIFEYIKRSIQNATRGSIQDNINIEFLSRLKLKIPKLDEQKRIAELLSTIDQKIALNNRINAELEAMAKTIYDYWFVQFDFPISKEKARVLGKPKLEGKPYKASGGKMVWSEELKREIPFRWDVKQLQELGNFKNGVNYNPSNPGKVACPIINVRNISASSYFLNNEDLDIIYLNESDVRKYAVHQDSIIIARSGIPGATRLIADIADNTLYCGFAIHYELNNRDLKIPIFFYLKSIEQQIQNGSGGTILKNVNQATLNSLQKALPKDNAIILRFNELIQPIFNKLNLIQRENQKLTELRDWLLPMLMNGQVKIKEAIKSKVSTPVLPQSKPASSYFYQTQIVAAIVKASKKHRISHGEMTLAKYTYLVDRIYGVPTYFNYERLHLGPYPKEMKKIINNKKFFKIQNNEVSVVPQKKEYSYQFQQHVEDAIAELASLFNQYKGKERSHQTELLATVCKVVEDIKSTDLKAVRESMKKWPIKLKGDKFKNKAEKFSEEETNDCLELIQKMDWHLTLVA